MPEHVYRALVLSVVKHDYLPNAVASHPRFQGKFLRFGMPLGSPSSLS